MQPAEVVSKLVEVILQSRIEIKKNQFRKFQNILRELSLPKSFNNSLSTFYSEMLFEQLYSVRNKLHGNPLKVQISFTLRNLKTGEKIQAQFWEIKFTSKTQIISDYSFQVMTNICNYLISSLSKKPLFQTYQKDKKCKENFELQYRVLIQSDKKCTILDMPIKQFLRRENKQLIITLSLVFKPSLQQLKSFPSADPKRKGSLEQEDESGKVSVYAFYDPILDFTFLSSDDDVKNKTLHKSQHIQLDLKEDSQEYQMMMINEEQAFLEYNKAYFCDLALNEQVLAEKNN